VVETVEPGGDILVVDNDEFSRTWARRRLEKENYCVREAQNAQQALEEITRDPPDLILLDVMLPGVDGFEFTRKLRQDPNLAATPIIVLTTLDDLKSKVEGLEAGASDYVTKMPEPEELLARIRALLRLKRVQEALLGDRNRTALLLRVGRQLSAELDLETLLSQILEQTVDSLGATMGSLILLDQQGAALRNIYYHQGEVTMIAEQVKGRIIQDGLAGWVIQQREGVILRDSRQDPRWIVVENIHAKMVSVMSVPMVQQDRVAGVLTITHESVDRFTPADLDLLKAIASQAGIALANAQLFEAVEQERGHLKAILTGTNDGIVATDKKGRIVLLNPAAERIFGLSLRQVAGRSLEESIPFDSLIGAFGQAREAIGSPPPSELALPDGRTLFFTVSPVESGPKGEGGYVAVMQDITHLKELDRMKNEFVSTVSHDLRTPLATIHGYTEVLEKTVQDPDGKDLIQQIRSGTLRMANLVEELLDLGKIESGIETARERCRLDQIVAEAVEEACFHAESADIVLSATLPIEPTPVEGNPTRLRQVVDNLIHNAIKYTPPGGTISVWLWEKAGKVTVTVQDSGIGIPREALPRLFEKFYRVPCPDTPKTRGAGLGLAIVKAVVEQHGGQVWVQSKLGEGSTFGFSLPSYEHDDRTL
jgi:PAS domain S-box-containing protein